MFSFVDLANVMAVDINEGDTSILYDQNTDEIEGLQDLFSMSL